MKPHKQPSYCMEGACDVIVACTEIHTNVHASHLHVSWSQTHVHATHTLATHVSGPLLTNRDNDVSCRILVRQTVLWESALLVLCVH